MRIRLWYLLTFCQQRLSGAYRRMVCGACGGRTLWLPSAPGWFDSQRCCTCGIDWDDCGHDGRIRASDTHAQRGDSAQTEAPSSMGSAVPKGGAR